MLTAEPAFGTRAEIGESPLWDETSGDLLWVDTMVGTIHRRNVQSGRMSAFSVGAAVGSIVLTESGALLAAASDGFRLITSDGGIRMLAPVEAYDSETRMNDGRCDLRGRFWAGTMELNAAPRRGSLYRLDLDLSVQKMVTEVSCSNGIGWSPDATLMYYVDSPTGRVDVFDFDLTRGEVSGRRQFVSVGSTDGVPDGLCVDSLGYVWVAIWGGGQVRRYSPRGELDTRVDVPVRCPTSCAFGGQDLSVLFITTASVGSDREDIARGAGDVFSCRLGVSGATAVRFAGQ